MKILGIETSCDETAAAVLETQDGSRFDILSNVVLSQIPLHQEYGGVHPALAKREHKENLPSVLRQAVGEGGKPDLAAVTVGPGLAPCLWQGIEAARTLNLPVVPTDHMEGHLLAALLQKNGGFAEHAFPAVGLAVSGGHTELVLMQTIGEYRILGETRDDAAGEAFDKTARILGLPYPGGPEIAKRAELASTEAEPLPRPMLHTKDYDFSFSGLKTAVLYRVGDRTLTDEEVNALAKEVQDAVVDVLVAKTLRAAEKHRVKSVLLGGGVAANRELQTRMGKALEVPLLRPLPGLEGDNAVMIALAGWWHRDRRAEELKALPNLRIDEGVLQ